VAAGGVAADNARECVMIIMVNIAVHYMHVFCCVWNCE